MAPAMKAMKKAGASGLSATAAFSKVADSTELKPKQVKAVVTSYLALAAGELKEAGKFKLGGMLNMKLKKKLAVGAMRNLIASNMGPYKVNSMIFEATCF